MNLLDIHIFINTLNLDMNNYSSILTLNMYRITNTLAYITSRHTLTLQDWHIRYRTHFI